MQILAPTTTKKKLASIKLEILKIVLLSFNNVIPSNISENAIDTNTKGKKVFGSWLLVIKFMAIKGKNSVKIKFIIIKNFLSKLLHHLTNKKLCIIF